MTTDDIMNGMVLGNDECIVALTDSGAGLIIATSDSLRDHDVITELYMDDNGVNSDWDKGLSVGIYLLRIKPWAYKDQSTGEWEAGVDVKEITPLWVAAAKPEGTDKTCPTP